MKKLTSLLEYNRFRIAIGYIVLVLLISFIAASFREDLDPAIEKLDQDTVVTASPDTVKTDSVQAEMEKELAIDKKISAFISKNGGIIFDEKIFVYTLDYQERFKDTVAIFYVFIEDIFEEQGRTYLKAKKIFSDIQVFLKLECDTAQINKVRKIDFFVNIAAEINSVEKVLFFTKAKITETDDPEEEKDAYITFDTLEEGIMMSGKCLEVLI